MSTWSHCWSTRPTRKASSPTCATWCPGPRSTAWCLGMAPTRKPSPRFWILFPRRRSYPSWASTEGRPWSWLTRYGAVCAGSCVDKEWLATRMLLMIGRSCAKEGGVNGRMNWLNDCFGLEGFAKHPGLHLCKQSSKAAEKSQTHCDSWCSGRAHISAAGGSRQKCREEPGWHGWEAIMRWKHRGWEDEVSICRKSAGGTGGWREYSKK